MLLGRSVGDLVDRFVPLADPWGERLARELAGLGSNPSALLDTLVVQRLERALLSRLSTRTRGDRSRSDLVRAATTILSVSTNVRATARRVHISERQLRNLFTESVGVSPKHFARIDRVRAVLADAGHEHLALLAAKVGYYDQSHMTAEFRALMGVPPGAYVAGRRPAPTPCRTP